MVNTLTKHRSSKDASRAAAQIDKFKETARKLGADEDEAAFEAKLRKIAQPKMPAPTKK